MWIDMDVAVDMDEDECGCRCMWMRIKVDVNVVGCNMDIDECGAFKSSRCTHTNQSTNPSIQEERCLPG